MPESKSLKSGTCPKCNSYEVYTTSGTTKRGERIVIPVTGWKFLLLDIYICLNCGHFEEYISDKDIKDESFIEKVKINWKKVSA